MNNLEAIYKNKTALIAVIGWLLFVATMVTKTIAETKCKAQLAEKCPVVEMKK